MTKRKLESMLINLAINVARLEEVVESQKQAIWELKQALADKHTTEDIEDVEKYIL